MQIVTVNSGSTSVKLAAFRLGPGGSVLQFDHEHRTGKDLVPRDVLAGFLSRLGGRTDAIAHRIVHGGNRFTAPVALDTQVLHELAELSELAPLHNPKALEWIEASRAVAPAEVLQVAAFDTAFFATLPRLAAEYALPERMGAACGVRRYGFHGLAHQAMWRRWCELHPTLPAGGRLLTLQLGGGCSIAAIARGRPLDTTMGFSPLEGLVMETRSGDIDAAVVPYLARHLGVDAEKVIELLNREAGVAGLSGGVTDLGKLAADPSPQAQFALDLYCYRARKYMGAYLSVLGGCDGIVFGGGVGEHVPAVRERILGGMKWAGVELDPAANQASRGQEAAIQGPGSRVRVHVIVVDEERELVRAALERLNSHR